LLAGLPLEDFLLYGAGRDEAIDETWEASIKQTLGGSVKERAFFFLSITPHASQSLLIGSRIPIYERVNVEVYKYLE
jgi:hypothetical protein